MQRNRSTQDAAAEKTPLRKSSARTKHIMDLHFNTGLARGYKSNNQVARVLTEAWVNDNMYCPRCGGENIKRLPNNTPVGDFICPLCGCQYELKSKAGRFGRKVPDGAYDTMIQRILGNQNPDFSSSTIQGQITASEILYLYRNISLCRAS